MFIALGTFIAMMAAAIVGRMMWDAHKGRTDDSGPDPEEKDTFNDRDKP